MNLKQRAFILIILFISGAVSLEGCSDPVSTSEEKQEVIKNESAKENIKNIDAEEKQRDSSDAGIVDSSREQIAEKNYHEQNVQEIISDSLHDQDPQSYCPVINFKSCGGDPSGDWNILVFCPDDPVAAQKKCESPFSNEKLCTTAENNVQCYYSRKGTLNINKTRFKLDMKSTLHIKYIFSADCVKKIKSDNSAANACQKLSSKMSCQFVKNLCLCEFSTSPPATVIDAEYQKKGNQLIIGPNKKRPIHADFCIQGKTLTLDITPHIVSWRCWLFQK